MSSSSERFYETMAMRTLYASLTVERPRGSRWEVLQALHLITIMKNSTVGLVKNEKP